MDRKILYLLHFAAKLFFAAALLLFPVFFHGLYGNTYSMNGIRLGRYLAVFMIAVSYMAWNFRYLPKDDPEAKTYSIATTLEWGLIGLFFFFHTLDGGYNYLGWITTGLCVVFAVLFGIDGFKDS